MDAIPEFYLQQLELRNGAGEVQIRMELSQPVSENPVISFDLDEDTTGYTLWLRDNGGNEFTRPL